MASRVELGLGLVAAIVLYSACGSPGNETPPLLGATDSAFRSPVGKNRTALWATSTQSVIHRRTKSVAKYRHPFALLKENDQRRFVGHLQAQHFDVSFGMEGLRLDDGEHQVTLRTRWDALLATTSETNVVRKVRALPGGWVTRAVVRPATDAAPSRVRAHVDYGLSDHGVVQRFVWEERPSESEGGVAIATFHVDGLEPVLASREPGGHAKVALRKDGKVVFWYRGVFAEDADHTPLRAWMDVSGQTIQLHVDTKKAHFPVVVDPLIATETHTLRSPHTSPTTSFASGYTGYNLALFADRLVVGAFDSSTSQGHFDRFDRLADGSWQWMQTAPYTDSLRAAGADWFATGSNVWTVGSNGDIAQAHVPFACSDTDCRVTMLAKDIAVEVFRASWGGMFPPVRLYHRATNGTWSQSHELADDCQLQLISPTRVLASCGQNNPRTFYDLSAVGVLSNPESFPPIPVASALSAAFSEDRILLNNPWDSTYGDQSGKVEVYREATPGTWSQVDDVFATNPHTEADFGRTTIVFGDTIVVPASAGFAWGGLYSYRWSTAEQRYVPGPVLAPLDDLKPGSNLTRAALGPRRLAAVPHRDNEALVGYRGAVHVYRLATELGDDCTVAEECENGICVDGRCCASLCEGECQSCSVAGQEGTCAPLPAGTDPDSECGTDSCGGSGSCARQDGTECDSSSGCESGECVDGFCCEGICAGGCERCNLAGNEGKCASLPAQTACGPFVCDGTSRECPDRCTTSEECAPGFGCTQAGLCAAVQAVGGQCSTDDQCDSGHCVSGTCCNQACDGPCATCGDGVCDVDPCGDYVCGETECLQGCDTSADCTEGRRCHADGKCSPDVPATATTPDSCSLAGPPRPSGTPVRGLFLAAGAMLLMVRLRFRPRSMRGSHARVAVALLTATVAFAGASCRTPERTARVEKGGERSSKAALHELSGTSLAIITRRKAIVEGNSSERQWRRTATVSDPHVQWSHHTFRAESLTASGRLRVSGPGISATFTLSQLRRGKQVFPVTKSAMYMRGAWLNEDVVINADDKAGVHVRYGVLDSGLLQLLELKARPFDSHPGPLSIQFNVSGLDPVLADARNGGHARIALRDKGEAKLWIRGVYAADSRGRSLQAWLTVHEHGYAIVVDDASAQYPIVIDPIVGGTTERLLSPIPANDDGYGRSVVLHDDLAFVAAPYANANDGAVDVFERQPDGTWLHRQRLTASVAGDEEFGDDIAFEGDDLLVMSGGGPCALTVLKRQPSGLFTEQHRFEIRAFSSSKRAEVRVANGVAAVTTSSASDGVQLYVRDPAGQWSFDTVVVPSFGAYFGSIATLWDDHLAVSRCRGGARVAVFDHQSDGSWLETQLIEAPQDVIAIGDAEHFGCTMAGYGDRLAIGSYGDDLGGYSAGSVHVFEDLAGVWTATASLTMPNSHPRERFGRSLSMNADFLAVGAVGHLVSGAVQPYRLGSSYEPGIAFVDPMAVAGHHLGRSTSLWTNRLAAGAKRFEFGEPSTPPGAVYVTILAESLGTMCAQAEDCASGLCVDGVCCNTSCSGVCETGESGTCSPIPAGLDPDGECGAAGACDGSGVCVGRDGSVCEASSQCLGGECVAGICCDRSCGGTCEACDVAGAEGTCQLVPAGTDLSVCAPFTCDGEGTECPSACTDDEQCANGFYCDGGACIDALPNGSLNCKRDGQCGSKQCVDGQCCDSACEGECLQCVSGACQLNDCGGHTCRSEAPERGACLLTCASTTECRAGFQCDGAGECVVPAPPAAQEVGGCTVATPTSLQDRTWPWWVMAGALAFRARRRRLPGPRDRDLGPGV